MASLSFNYEGARRPERDRPPLPFFGYGYYGYQPSTVQTDVPKTEQLPEQASAPKAEQAAAAKPTDSRSGEAGLSELLISRLGTAETELVYIREKVGTAKVFLEDIIYKLESILQIVEVIKSNEKRRTAGAQLASASTKTSKDSIDEILELLQTPAVQSIIRQVLLGVMMNKSGEADTAKMRGGNNDKRDG